MSSSDASRRRSSIVAPRSPTCSDRLVGSRLRHRGDGVADRASDPAVRAGRARRRDPSRQRSVAAAGRATRFGQHRSADAAAGLVRRRRPGVHGCSSTRSATWSRFSGSAPTSRRDDQACGTRCPTGRGAGCVRVEPQIGHGVQHGRDRRMGLEAGQVHARARVRARARTSRAAWRSTRAGSNRSGSVNTAGSRLAAAKAMITKSPRWIVASPTTTSRVA